MLKKGKLLFFSGTPFIIGFLLNYAIIAFDWHGSILLLFGLFFSVYWFWLGFKSYDYVQNGKTSLLLGHCFAIISIVFSLFQGIVHSRDGLIFDIVVFAPQMYYLPIIGLISRIERTILFFVPTHYLITSYILSFVFMIFIYRFGFSIRQKKVGSD